MNKEKIFKTASKIGLYFSPCIFVCGFSIFVIINSLIENSKGHSFAFMGMVIFIPILVVCAIAAIAFRYFLKQNVLKIWLAEFIFLIILFICFKLFIGH